MASQAPDSLACASHSVPLLNRRSVVVSAGAFLAMAGGSSTRAEDELAVREAVRDLYVFAYPLLEMARARARLLAGGQANVFRHATTLADHTSRRVTTPNNDTLYSSAWIDLNQGPVTLTVPAARDRYLSVALMDMYSNNFAYAGTRASNGRGVQLRLFAPGTRGRRDGITAPTSWVWGLGRTLVEGADDLAAARAVQQGLGLTGPAAQPPGDPPGRDAGATAELRSMVELIEANPPPRAHQERINQALRTVLERENDSAWSTTIEGGVADARRAVEQEPETAQALAGWLYPKPQLGNFGDDFLYRASIARWGLAALEPREAMYMRGAGSSPDRTYDGTRLHRLRFEPGRLPPARAFWSLSLYETTPEGDLFFTPNPLNRYAIGDRTPGLTRDADGGLTLWIGPDPGEARRANWLPAPDGRFALVLRAYLPEPELLSGDYRLPPVEPL